MPGTSIVKNVFLDTQAFESNQYDFGNKSFQALCTAVAAGLLRVYSTEVTKREVEKRLKERTAEAVGHLKTFQKQLKVRCIGLEPFVAAKARVSVEDAQNDALKQLRAFWENAKIEMVPIFNVDVEKVFNDYFAVKPPFGTGDKKAEFPDAFAAQALAAWCVSKKQKMIVVTDDGDWEALCQGHSHLIHKAQLAEVLAAFPDPKISKAIRDSLLERMYDVEQYVNTSLTNLLLNTSMCGGSIVEVLFKNTEVLDIYVIQASGGSAIVEARCRLVYVSRVRYDPMGLTHRTPRQWKPTRKFPTKTRAIAEFRLTYNPTNPSEYEINTIDIRQLARPFSDDW
jgi:PIN domain-containing protein